MWKLKEFWKSTKLISKILIITWVILVVLCAAIDIQFSLFIAPILAIEFLVPAILIEGKTNPLLKKKLKIRHIFGFVFLLIAIIGLVMYIQNPIDDPVTGNQASGNRSIAIVFSIIALFCFVLPIKRKSSKGKIQFQFVEKNSLSSQEVNDCNDSEINCNTAQLIEEIKLVDGLYLSKEQIYFLKHKHVLPKLDVSIPLSKNEVAVYRSKAVWQELKKDYDINKFCKKDVKSEHKGELIVTNNKVIFLNNDCGFNLLHQWIFSRSVKERVELIRFECSNTDYQFKVPNVDILQQILNYLDVNESYIEHETVEKVESLNDRPLDISSVDGMDGHEFEYFCADLLKNNGFYNVEVTKGSGDQGVDILAEKDGIKYAVQCKNYSSSLGNTPVQEVNSGKIFYKCHIGVVLTNSTFTTGAKELAESTGTLLWDRSMLEKLLKTKHIRSIGE